MDGYFRGQELFGAVKEGTEMDAFLSDFSHSAKAEYLESAAVRQDALRPVHEGMKAAGFPDKVIPLAEDMAAEAAEAGKILNFGRRKDVFSCMYRH